AQFDYWKSLASVSELDLGRAYHTIPDAVEIKLENPGVGAISPDERWLVLGDPSGLRLWDLARCDGGRLIRTGLHTDAAFEPSGRAVLANSGGKVFRWPVKREAELLRIGPPELMPFPGSGQRIAVGRDRRTFAIADGTEGGRIYALDDLKPVAKRFD